MTIPSIDRHARSVLVIQPASSGARAARWLLRSATASSLVLAWRNDEDGAGGRGPARHRFERNRALRLVGMIRPDVKLQLRHHVHADLVLGHHPLDRKLQDLLGTALEQLPRGFVPSARRDSPNTADKTSVCHLLPVKTTLSTLVTMT